MADEKPFEPRVAAAAIYRELVRIREALERMSPPPAPAVDLDSPRGDPKVRMIPRDWKGEKTFKGGPMSAAPPDLLDMLAETLEYFASKNTDPKKAKYDRLDAARARAWAERKRSGWKPLPSSPAAAPSSGASAPSYEPPRFEPPKVEAPIADDEFPFGANAPASDEDDDLPTFE
jgi:hypothetical protein